MNKTDLKEYTLPKLQLLMEKLGKKKFHGTQLFRWIYRQYTTDFSEMTNLSLDFRTELEQEFCISPLTIEKHLTSQDGTQKFLFRLSDNKTIETVLIPEKDRQTLCISSQVGCKMRCQFCATGSMGYYRNLTVNEIVSQVWSINRLLHSKNSENSEEIKESENKKTVTNIVFMGMGEPLDNFDQVVDAVNIFTEMQGLGISQRKVIVSTCGIVQKFQPLADQTNARLAISLHSPDDEVRTKIMPINKKYDIASIMEGCKYYYRQTKKSITFEYILINGVNDSIETAKRLVKLLKPISCKINLIPYNQNSSSSFTAPDEKTIKSFQKYLLDNDIRALLRITRGDDITAACGQLSSLQNNTKNKM